MMASKQLMFFCVIFFIFATVVVGHQRFDHLKLVQQWIPSYCRVNGHCIAPVPDVKFGIHGLWPDVDTDQDSPPQPDPLCPAYIMFQDRDLLEDLYEDWPDVVNDPALQKLWESEWYAHGAISHRNFTQLMYFEAALDLVDQYPILMWLAEFNVYPNHLGTLYTGNDVRNAIVARTHFEPDLRCKMDGTNNFLLEIIICTDASGDSTVNCPQPSDSCFLEYFIYPRR